MANEIEEKKVEAIKKVDCFEVADMVITIVDPGMNLSQEDTIQLYQIIVSKCEKANNN